MTGEQLSRIFAALADPTRRDMVTRLAAGDATVNQLAEPYQICHPGGLQAPEGARGRRGGEPAAGAPSLGRCGWKRRSST